MRLSFSRFMRYKTCPLWYYFEMTLPVEEPPSAELLLGKLIHTYFHSLLKFEEEKTPEAVWNEIESSGELMSFENMKKDFSSFDELRDYYRSLRGKIILFGSRENYIKKIENIMDNARKISHTYRHRGYRNEVWLSESYGDLEIVGIIDLLGDGEFVELKTGGKNDNHIEQLKFYSMLYYLNRYIAPKGYLVYLSTGEIEEYRFSVRELENMFEDVKKVGRKIRNNIFPARKGSHCNYCPYRGICEYR